MDITIIDPDHSIELMRSGDVIAALSSSREPVYGFKVYHLGCAAHRAVASPDFIKRHFKHGVTAIAVSNAPSLRYDSQDGLIIQWLEQVFKTSVETVSMRLPCRNGIIDSCLRGATWGVLPDHELGQNLSAGTLTELLPETPVQKDLYWHVSSAMAEPIAQITTSIRKVARSHL